jgi:hypothetical protein
MLVWEVAKRAGESEDLPLWYYYAGMSRSFKDQGSRVQSLNPSGFKDFF